MTELLTIIYAPEEEYLLPFQGKATHWLPENSDDADDIYQLRNTVCTTKKNILEMLEILIIECILPFDKVIWLNVSKPQDCIAYTFSPLGKINNFFKVQGD